MPEQKNEVVTARPQYYFIYMIVVLMFVEILDTYTTIFPTVIPSKIIEEFLGTYPLNVATSIFAISVGIATLGMYLVFFNQFMADRVGRKILLVFTVFGMGFSSLLLALSTDIIQYTIFLFLLYIFFSSDMWVIYINEECAPDKRAFWTNIVLIGGVVGALIVPIFRSIFITDTISNWRGLTLFAILLGIPLGLLLLFTFKETSKYQEIKAEKSLEQETTKLFKENIRTLFKADHRKPFLVVLIMSFIGGLNYLFVSLGESFIANSPNLTESDVNIIVLTMSVAAVIGYFITGIIADKYGRKPLIYGYSILLPISILIAVIGTTLTENALIVVSLGAGLANAAYWSLGVVIRLVTLEVIPTDARGTGSGLKSLTSALGITSGLFLSSVITLYFGLALAFVFYSLILLVNVPLVYLYLKETKGIDLSDIH
ncbi:MAG: MFS transporter [Promethearchaeota archaeon]